MDKLVWGSYQNIHRSGSFYYRYFCFVTQKIDGSNLGAHMAKNEEGDWELLSLFTRNVFAWKKGEDPELLSKIKIHGKVGGIWSLIDPIQNYVSLVGEALNVNEIVVYGEAYRAKNSLYPSWHPFGVKTDKVQLLNKRLHELFTNVSAETNVNPEWFYDHESLMSTLTNANMSIICPPPSIGYGKLVYLIDALHRVMMKNRENFEGVFIVLEEENFGFKWKTGAYEEQQKIPSIEEHQIEDPFFVSVYRKLEEVFNNRPKKQERSLDDDVKTALSRVMEKELVKTELTNKERLDEIERIVKLVVTEIKNNYIESDNAIPYTDQEILPTVRRMTTVSIMNPNGANRKKVK